MIFLRRTHPVEKKIGYRFKNLSLLNIALTHPSIAEDRLLSYQRLEFLGDAVLELSVSNFLFSTFPKFGEGELTEMRRKLVQKSSLVRRAEELAIYDSIKMGEGEQNLQGEARQSILADVFEAILGAVFLDSNFSKVNKLIKRIHLQNIDAVIELDECRNYKGEILEYSQSFGMSLDYKIDDIKGEKHCQTFFASVWISGKKLGEGHGFSKKAAEQNAAKMALEKLKENN